MRLATSGKGEGQPVAKNTSETGRQANRRVEIYVEPVTRG
jgi:flagellar motor protein MotB